VDLSACLRSLSLVFVQISIELKRHQKSAWRKTAEDTWTLKLKHTSRRFETKWNDDAAYHNYELPAERKSSAKSDRSWHINDGIVSDAEEIDVPIFSKLRRSGKAKKVKALRQLSPKSKVRRKTTTLTENKVTQSFAHEPLILREPFWGIERPPYAFSSINNDTRQVKNGDQTFREADETPWGHAAAIIYDSTEHHTTTIAENKPGQQADQQDKNSTGSMIHYENEKVTEPYALPLEQPEESSRAESDKGVNPLDDTNKRKIVQKYNYKSDTWKGYEGLDKDGYGDRLLKFTTERTDDADTSDKQQPTDTMSDYVIEDPTPRDYDTVSVGSEEEEGKHGITDERQDEHSTTDDRQEKHSIMDEGRDEHGVTGGWQDEHSITDERQDEHGNTDDRQNEHGITDEGQDEHANTDDRQDEHGNTDDRQNERGVKDERQDEHGITDERQDECGVTDERQDEHGITDERQDEHANTDYRQDEHGITDERQDEHGVTDERQDEHVITDERQDDFEPTAEMKRIMNWFPRSRLLTTENNGYKLFPGVSE